MSSHASPGSPRLLFEPLAAKHAAGLFEPLCNPRVWEHISQEPETTVAALADRFAFMASGPPPDRTDERWINYAVRLLTEGRLIGRLEATIVDRRAEVAFLFGPQYWGNGYAAEAMASLQENLRQAERVEEFWATTDPRNLRCIRLLERLGYGAVKNSWPTLLSYDPGDLVFVLR